MLLNPDMMADEANQIIEVQDLRTHFGSGGGGLIDRLFGTRRPPIRAVDGVNLRIPRGQVVGLVGESGSGKTTLGRTIIGLEKSTTGRVLFDGRDISKMTSRELRAIRPRLQLIQQDAAASLSPRFRVRSYSARPITSKAPRLQNGALPKSFCP